MKYFFPIIFLALACSMSWAQDVSSEVTDEQIAIYQQGIEAGCKDAGQRRGDPIEKVNAFCDCVLNVLVTELEKAEWQQAFFSSIRRDSQGQQEVLAPHLQKVAACRSAPNPADVVFGGPEDEAVPEDSSSGR